MEVLMKRFRLAVVAIVFMGAIAASSLVFAETVKVEKAEKAEKAEKGFWVEVEHLELDPVAAGSDAVGTFIFHNDTDKDVKIIKAKPS
jgi:hypothetical protein